MKRIVAVCVLGLVLLGCDDKPEQKAGADQQKPTICAPCVGPHLNLSNGRVEVFSTGPGVGL